MIHKEINTEEQLTEVMLEMILAKPENNNQFTFAMNTKYSVIYRPILGYTVVFSDLCPEEKIYLGSSFFLDESLINDK